MEARRRDGFMDRVRMFKHIDIWSLVPELSGSEFKVLTTVDMLSRGLRHGAKPESIARPDKPCKVTVSEIAEDAHMPMPAVSRGLRSLEKKEYIVRRTDETDRRNTLVEMTESGRKMSDGCCRLMRDLFDSINDRFGQDNTTELNSLLDELYAITQDEIDKRKENIKR